MVDRAGEPMLIARAPWLDIGLGGAGRYRELLMPALDEALTPIHANLAERRRKVGFAIGLPSPRPGCPMDLANDLCAAVEHRYSNSRGVVAFPQGHAAGFAALNAGLTSLRAGSLDACVVACVDSYMAAETLEWLEAAEQLHAAGAQNNAWGFIPGEAAAAIVVVTAAVAKELATQAYGEIVGVGLAHEVNLIKTDNVCVGEGLTTALRTALRSLSDTEKVDDVFCDLNGETYRADEFGFATLRTKGYFRAATDFVAPADCWGDVGAAGGPLHICLGLIAHAKRYGHGPVALSCGSSEEGTRGAAVVRAAVGARG
jgi:3-oxoacyl-[acyl-carrier-protein] synthase-1